MIEKWQYVDCDWQRSQRDRGDAFEGGRVEDRARRPAEYQVGLGDDLGGFAEWMDDDYDPEMFESESIEL